MTAPQPMLRRTDATARARGTAVRAPRQARAERCGGIEDRALYRCRCGLAFKAAVSTTVGCPSCGTQQAW